MSDITLDKYAAYLAAKAPTLEVKLLAEQIGQPPDATVPFWMFAELATRQSRDAAWIANRTDVEGKIKRKAWASLLALAGNLVLVVTIIGHRIKETGAAEERAAQQERSTEIREAQRAHEFNEYRESMRRDMDRMEQDIRDLRRDLRRLSNAGKLDNMSIVRLERHTP